MLRYAQLCERLTSESSNHVELGWAVTGPPRRLGRTPASDLAAVRRAMLAELLAGPDRLHFKNEKPSRRRTILSVIGELPVTTMVFESKRKEPELDDGQSGGSWHTWTGSVDMGWSSKPRLPGLMELAVTGAAE